MKPLAKIYAVILSISGIALGIFCLYTTYCNYMASENPKTELAQFLILFALAYICRCLPIYITEDFAIDMAFISNFAILLIKGPVTAAAITILGSIFIIEPSPDKKKKCLTIFNTPPLKSAFNAANLTISVYLGGLVFSLAGGIIGNINLPSMILPSLAMLLAIMTVNSVLLIILFKLNIGIPFFSSFGKNIIEFLPSVIASAPIGYFIAKFILIENGEYLVFFFVLPLLLARFAFSLYIESKRNYYVMLKTLTLAIEAKDEYTCGHSQRVEEYASRIAEEMHLSHSRIENLRVAALLHDVGKIGIDESILNKPAKLTSDERKQIEKHPQISIDILKEVNLPQVVFQVILHHHERFDGRGYPSGMGGSSLPIEVYILGVADTYDAITSTRPYSYASSPERAKEIILSESGKQFHPQVVEAFVLAFDKNEMTLVDRKTTEHMLLSV